jgi:3-hydroxyisobutyrate dehydrogenase-like beta-hydroxyacid dehydrogenase
MGSALGRSLERGGARVVTTLAGRSERTAGLAEGLELVESVDAVVAAADLVLSVVPPCEAPRVAADVRDAAKRTGARPLVADLNAISPPTAREIATDLADAGLVLVDGSISGPPPRPGATTRVYLSGARAGDVAALAAPGVAWRVVGDEVGAASAVKMSTASVYKGSVALLVQALRSAHANGVLEPVLDDLREAFPELATNASGTVQRAAAKAQRYVGEMGEIAATQQAAGLTPILFEALGTVYRLLAETDLARAAPEDADPSRSVEDVLDDV